MNIYIRCFDQASTFLKDIYSPNVVSIGSSRLGESSVSRHEINKVGIPLIDRFSFETHQFFFGASTELSNASLQQLMDWYNGKKVGSTPELTINTLNIPLEDVFLSEFFSSETSALDVIITDNIYRLE